MDPTTMHRIPDAQGPGIRRRRTLDLGEPRSGFDLCARARWLAPSRSPGSACSSSPPWHDARRRRRRSVPAASSPPGSLLHAERICSTVASRVIWNKSRICGCVKGYTLLRTHDTAMRYSSRCTSSPITGAPGTSPATSRPPEVCASASSSNSCSPTDDARCGRTQSRLRRVPPLT